MSWHHNKVIWSEGLFLRPHHFQQHDRYIENLVDARCRPLQAAGWGIKTLEIDQETLALGSFSLASCEGIFPDGTPFKFPGDAEAPIPITATEDLQDEEIFLVMPMRRPGSAETDVPPGTDPMARYAPREVDINDSNANRNVSATLYVGQPRLHLARETEDRDGFASLGVARIREVRPDQGIILNESYLPSYIDCSTAPALRAFITELQGLLRQRSEALATRVTHAARGGVSEIADFLLLQVVNRFEPLIVHFSKQRGIHPEHLYQTLIQIAGELSTFTREEKRPIEYAEYRHDNLEDTFKLVTDQLRRSLSTVLEQRAIELPLEEHKYGVRVARISDRSLVTQAHFVLAVNADVRAELLQKQFPTQVKIGPVEHIRQLVNAAIPGIGLRLLPVAPREIPYHAGHTYFELDRKNEYWAKLETSAALGVQVSDQFPGLQLELWAIRD
ncbi:MAG: type VI secretion system baseplate subunit TssK [Gammaproteobacteria bacterium]|nr:type VI secretion system baseplate subunit TssK [Gammaproteobacteria bacterium]MDH3465216.1 type VI secretion system baseplate subunit TssK [Gammaproteobacteria bacterium]